MGVESRLKNALLVVLIAFGVLLWALALALVGRGLENSDEFEDARQLVFGINFIGIGVLGGLIVLNLVRLIRDHRRHVPGVRLRVRMVSLLVILSVAPLVLVYSFSIEYVRRGFDSWFNIEFEPAIANATALARLALDLRQQDHLQMVRQIGAAISPLDAEQARSRLGSLREEYGARELTLFSENNDIIAYSDEETLNVALPSLLGEEIISLLRREDQYTAAEPLANGQIQTIVAVRVSSVVPGQGSRIVFAKFLVNQSLATLANTIEENADDFLNLDFQQGPLKANFTLALSLLLLISVLASVYGAFFAAQRLLIPIQQLMQGTRAVARGDYETRIDTPRQDEIGFLVQSFNEMTHRLADARKDASRSQQLVEGERQKLEVILAGLTTGVISLEPDMRIRTANPAAGAIFGVDLESRIGQPLSDLQYSQPLLQEFLDVTLRHLEKEESEWRDQIVVRTEVGRRVLMCACTALPELGEGSAGFVLVFDDITALLQAQRDAAWGEVARRLAHEIKNPLTPIQLSAERVRRRYLTGGGDDDLQLLDRATHTIIQQVEALKEMVDAFRLYARAPDLELAPLDLNQIIAEVMELYRPHEKTLAISLTLDENLPRVEADDGRIRQLFHNLMRNAMEAMEGRGSGNVEISTRAVEIKSQPFVEIRVADNGPGFSSELLDQAFEPYVTSKLKGTGLGLAIVKKIVEEHGGQIRAANRQPEGAEISILIPVSGTGTLSHPRPDSRRQRA